MPDKATNTDKSYLKLQVDRKDKARWVRAAMARNMKLQPWVVDTLNKQADKPT